MILFLHKKAYTLIKVVRYVIQKNAVSFLGFDQNQLDKFLEVNVHWNNNYSILYIYFTLIPTRRVITTRFQLISSIQKFKLPNIIYFTRQLLSPRYISSVKDRKVSTQKHSTFRLFLAFRKLISFLLSFSYFFSFSTMYIRLSTWHYALPPQIKIIPLNLKNIFLSATRNVMAAYNQFAC